ncbi:mechanosensitive ion channel protein MscS [Thermoplasmatales archaeon ex4572_165]|nr:MAG: mechanosensitive ion channel protein MscS [Thermoplasmatales archaeon ex4572_165]RLF58997.1 MAG: mechanosensitive ion channel family protein [Thermoplasmata archaeon]
MHIGTNILDLLKYLCASLNLTVDQLILEVTASIGTIIIFIILGWIVYKIIEQYVTRWAAKTKTKLDDEILKNIKKPIYFFVLLIGTYSGLEILSPLNNYSDLMQIFFIVAEISLITFIITRIVNVFTVWYSERESESMSEHIIFVLKRVINGTIYLFTFIIILYVLDIDLSGIVVGLGVGGIAIAFALQSVLGDAFSAFSIYFDRPFEIGDFIIVGEYSGTVKKIGMKSTRVQLLQGEELVMANSVLTTSNVRNFKKMQKRRVGFNFGVIYSTPSEKLKKIPDIVRKIIDENKLNTPDRIHFKEFGEFSLNFEAIYYIANRDYAIYMDVQQEINVKIVEAFEKEGIEMAFPTQTIHMANAIQQTNPTKIETKPIKEKAQ